MSKMATKVTLRRKSISKDRQSLYLDFYPAIINPETGKTTRRMFLGLYLHDKPKNAEEKKQNKESLEIAEQIRTNRYNNLNKREVYTELELAQLRSKELGEKDFTEYFYKVVESKIGKSQHNWRNAYNHWVVYAGGPMKFKDLTPEICEGFRSYLLTARSIKSKKANLSINSAALYFIKFRTVVKTAYKRKYIKDDLTDETQTITMVETHKKYLTLDELNKLAKTDCRYPVLKRAALFSALTGLRFSDILKLKWGEIEVENDNYQIRFRQQKTKGVEVLPISQQAVDLLGAAGEVGEQVFSGFKSAMLSHRHFYFWLADAGIKKEITFHSFRHTYATLQLAAGTDIYTVSKMLGHKSIRSTQVYTKVVNQLKREATNRIKLDM